MKHVVIGTAGHVDHGKTLLIKALTGIDTDRLQEEKKRGITIETGFAHLDFEDGTQAGIVDVPGHEKFIKNMLAGAGGIDLALLVVAADEGFMPQTVEHLGILTLLGIKDGLVAVTKADLAEPEWLEMMLEEIRERVKGTFLEGKPILPVSAHTGRGVPELKEALHTLVLGAREKNMRVAFRLPIDRVFSVDGFGTVVTGTLVEGAMREGDAAVLAPSGAETRIRNLQVHGRDVDTAYAGQRVAVNLAGLKRSDVRRGDAVAKPGSLRPSLMLDVRLENLPSSQRVIESDSQVHLYHGAAVNLAKAVLLDRDSLNPGESCYAQLRMTEPVAAKNGDRFVIRFLSPLETIGGGTVLDDAPKRRKRGDPAALEALRIRESGSGGDRIVQVTAEFATALPDADQLASKLSMDVQELEEALRELTSAGRLVEPLPGRFAASAVMDGVRDGCRALLEDYHRKNPLHAGMKAAELRQKLFKSMEQAAADALLRQLCAEGSIRRIADRYALAEFSVRFTKKQSALRERLLESFRIAGIEPPATEEVMARFSPQEAADAKQVLDSVLTVGELVMLSPQICYHKDAWRRAQSAVREHFASHETITLAELRDALGTSRKYALAILEYLDRFHVTKKEGDLRRLANRSFLAEDGAGNAP